ncbi:MAG: imidazole glycerol phosphate synthase subunit HisH [Firmicutes bacterium]|nr:imidazole glycerol phosphate synthase subunit HisH [Bacillota bacterium]
MIALIDYEVGNLFSLQASLKKIGADSVLTRDPDILRRADGIILPGVGAFGEAAEKLKSFGLYSLLREIADTGKPFLGVCLGMQLLFEKSYEYGEHEGLCLLPGYIGSLREDLSSKDAIVPHMGWNELYFTSKDVGKKWTGKEESIYTYFVHSFYAKDCEEVLIADTEYEGIRIPAFVGKDNVFGMQFHPEKSGDDGLRLLSEFIKLTK